jgi:hypothetical protein
MSEEKVEYKPAGGYTTAQTIQAFRNRPCSLPFSDPGYKAPEPEEVDALIKAAGWSQNKTAMIVGVPFDPKKGSTTIRRWRTSRENADHYREIPYAAWRLMLLHAGVVTVEEGLQELEKQL